MTKVLDSEFEIFGCANILHSAVFIKSKLLHMLHIVEVNVKRGGKKVKLIISHFDNFTHILCS